MTKFKNTIARLVLALVIWASPEPVHLQINITQNVVIQQCVAQSHWAESVANQ